MKVPIDATYLSTAMLLNPLDKHPVVPHHDATPNHKKHLESVMAEAKAKRERKNKK